MTEDFLHHIWKYRLFSQAELSTEAGEAIDVLKTGEHNMHAGPDFFNARIKIEDKIWAGNVEIHIKASDWTKHKHHNDTAYNNVILHVVFEADKPVYRKDGSLIPVLSLNTLFDDTVWQRYLYLQNSEQWVACSTQLEDVDAFYLNNWMDRLLVERMEAKSAVILNSLKLNNNNWEETFYQQLARNFGFKVNAVPFELLAKSLPMTYLGKHKDQLMQLEAMLLGQAGLLDDFFTDVYPLSLQKEYRFLKQKFSLRPIEKHLWKFMRLRPHNFPLIRIAQFAMLTYKSSHLFSKILETESVTALQQLFDVELNGYWSTHFVFDKLSPESNKSLGKAAVDVLLINTIAPFLFVYGMQKGEERYKERAISILEQLNPENNSIISNWKLSGIEVANAAQTQALLQLKNEYCSAKKCLSCAIGNKLVGKNASFHS